MFCIFKNVEPNNEQSSSPRKCLKSKNKKSFEKQQKNVREKQLKRLLEWHNYIRKK